MADEPTTTTEAPVGLSEADELSLTPAPPRRRRRAASPAGQPTLPDPEIALGTGPEAEAVGPETAVADPEPMPDAELATEAEPAMAVAEPVVAEDTSDPVASEAEVVAEPADVSPSPVSMLFQAPQAAPARRRRATSAAGPAQPAMFAPPAPYSAPEDVVAADDEVAAPRTRRRATMARSRAATSAPPAPADLVEGLLDDLGDPRIDAAAPVDPAEARLLAHRLADEMTGHLADGGAAVDVDEADDDDEDDDDESGARPRRRRRGGRGRRRRQVAGEEAVDGEEGADGVVDVADAVVDVVEEDDEDEDDVEDDGGASRSARRRRRRRRRGGGEDDLTPSPDDPPGTVVKVREARPPSDDVASVRGSTRLEAKRQRRREGRDSMRRRPVITEAEFLARRESVDRTLLVRDTDQRTQIAVLEDGILVEHYVTRAAHQSMIGNVHLGKVQNVLPGMEAAFVDIGRGRNAVLYAGEINWDSFGLEGRADRRIEAALKPGDTVLVQVTKDPVGAKGARLTSQISLPGRFLVYVPGGSMTGISRKLPDTERTRLKRILKRVLPEDSGVIVRTAAEGAAEEDLERDVARLTAQWADIERKSTSLSAPVMLYSEPDLAIRVVRDAFNEDFKSLVVQGDDLWDTLQAYVSHVAPDLATRMSRWSPEAGAEQDLFVAHRLDEQIAKGLERKVYLPSGGSLVIDRTEAMTVVDVNTGKYTGSGGDLEETVTRNNLEAAEEIVRQLRLRDIGGIIVIDFIDMVMESNRALVLRRLVECLGRDRTKHQVAEVTSLGLVQMTRKRVGQGLLEAFSSTCEHCHGRGVVIHDHPVDAIREDEDPRNGSANGDQARYRRGRRVDQPA